MNKLEQLIQELCPHGVEYKKLGEVAEIYDGTHTTPKYTNEGVLFVSVENIDNLYGSKKFISQSDFESYKIKPQIGDVFMTRIGSIGKCAVVLCDVPLAYYVSLALIRPNFKYIDSKFLKYIIESFHGEKELYKRTLVNAVPIKINKEDIGKILLPVPPLEIQKEIVRILDTFTELEEKLEKELKVRKKQYEFYKDLLLNFSNVSYYELRELCDIVDYRGRTPKKVDNGIFLITAKNVKAGYIDYTNSQEFISKNDYEKVMSRGLPQKGDVIITTEAPCGNVAQIDNENVALAQRIIKYRGKSCILNNSFLKYILLGNEFQLKLKSLSTGGTVKGIKGSVLHKIKIPLPPLEEQERIVNILDRFDALCNDLTCGLPAEIEARRKQYAYYRDKLLTFKNIAEGV